MLRSSPMIFIFGLYLISLVAADCNWNGLNRSVGETWQVAEFGPCVNCTCIRGEEGDRVDCEHKTCPEPDCAKPEMVEGSCCPVCQVATDNGRDENEQLPGCSFKGQNYSHSEKFPSNQTALRSNGSQCVMCICLKGEVFCHVKSCPVIDRCSAYINTSDSCCPVCADDVLEYDLDDPVSSVEKLPNYPKIDCILAGAVRKNGSTWRPSLPNGLGQVDCVTCTCVNGEIICKNKTCRKRRKKCKKNKKGKKKCKTGRNPRTTALPSTTTTAAIGIDINSICLPKRSEFLVYRSIGETEVFMAFDDLKKKVTEVFRWEISDGSHGSQVVTPAPSQTLSSEEFRRLVKEKDVLGASGKKHYRKFKRRLKRKMGKCTDKCQPKTVISLFKKVKVKHIKFGKSCKT